MTTRLYTPQDYPTVAAWWDGHKQPPVPPSVLPVCGVIVEEEALPIAAAWLYQDNSVGVAWLAWIVSNPDVSAFDAEKALDVLLGGCEAVARDLNRGVLFTMTDRGSLGRWFERNGFVRNHTGMSQFWKNLKYGP